MFDRQILLPLLFLFFAAGGFVCFGFAIYWHHRRERGAADQRATVAIIAFIAQCAFASGLSHVSTLLLLPTIVLFLIAVSLAIAILLGLRSKEKSGVYIALASFFMVGAYICRFGAGL